MFLTQVVDYIVGLSCVKLFDTRQFNEQVILLSLLNYFSGNTVTDPLKAILGSAEHFLTVLICPTLSVEREGFFHWLVAAVVKES